jgi:phenylacetate-coenzyme A ligase PaaK-like adenylate-forming protein
MKISPLNTIAARDIQSEPTHSNIVNYQIEKIMETIDYVRSHSRFYREKFANFGNISGISDFEKLPFTYPDDLSADSNSFMCLPLDNISRVVTLATSGTTGLRKRLFFTEDELERAVEFFAVGMTAIAEKNGITAILLPGDTPASVADLLRKALNASGNHGIILSVPLDFNITLKKINDCRADCIVGLPSHIFALARSGAAHFIKSVLLISDYSANSLIREIKMLWNCAVYTHYGLTESGYGGAVMCGCCDGMHIRETDLYVEIINSKSGGNVPDGDWGEVVFTTLNRVSQPLIRYRTGDLSRIIPEICDCGSELRRLDKILGRVKSSFIFNNGEKITMPELDEVIYGIPGVKAFEALADSSELTVTINGGNATFVLEKLKELSQLNGVDVRVIPGNVKFKGAFKREIAKK